MKSVILKVQVTTEEQTKKLAADLAEQIKDFRCVTLNGDLGAGKTFFVRCFAELFGVPRVSSPTFALVNVYEAQLKIYHLDFYRLITMDELFDIGFFEMCEDEQGIMFIEWADMFKEILPKRRIAIDIELNEKEERIFTVTKYE